MEDGITGMYREAMEDNITGMPISIYTMCDLYSIYGVLFTVRNGHLLELWLVFFACVSVG